MTFNNLHIDTDCNCVGKAVEKLENIFARRVRSNPLKENDFKSKWEKKHPYPGNSDCEVICSHKGVSINLFSDETKDAVIKKFVTRFTFSPGSTAFCCKFKFKQGAGKLKQTGLKDKSHHEFFKCDTFSLKDLEILDYVDIRKYVSN